MWNKEKRPALDRIDTLIAANVCIEGNVHYSGGIQIDGQVRGNIIADDDAASLRITNKGSVSGDIKGPTVIINGKVDGNVYSTDHLELESDAVITGDVHYHLIEMVMGAEVNGKMVHIEEAKINPVVENHQLKDSPVERQNL